MQHLSRVLGGILLVAGTTIGAAMLVLPVTTGLAGFFPAALLMLFFWMFMACSAFCFLEVNTWIEEDTDIISMAGRTLGSWGQAIAWGAYLFLLYALITAYLALSAPIFLDAIGEIVPLKLPNWVGTLPLVFLFSWVIYKGTSAMDHLNRLLMVGLGVAYFALVVLVAPHVDAEKLAHQNWGQLVHGIPIVATAFGYHIIIPSLHTYMGRDTHKMIWVLCLGSLAPFIVFLLWELLALGTIPVQGEISLESGFRQSASSAYLIRDMLGSAWIGLAAKAFSFFAITTSILGVSLSLAHFLADGFGIKRTPMGRMALCGLTFVPPLFLVLTDPTISFKALDYAGVVGVVFLLGVMPMLMVWWGRYRHQFPKQEFRVVGGKPLLLLGILLGFAILAWEIAEKFGLIQH